MKLEVKNLSKTYGTVKALDDISMEFTDGIYGILGPNGAGKSTFINLLTTNVERECGSICWDGRDILEMGAEYRSLVGYMPQEQCLYPNYTPMEFLRYMAAVKGISRKDAKIQIQRLLETVNLWDVRNKKIGTFSGGMRQRAMLAQALLGDPKILIMDEPTAGLDPNERIRIRNYIVNLSSNRIVFFTTHVVSDIEAISDRIVMMKNGRILCSGTTESLIERMEGKVGWIYCQKEQITQLQEKYHSGNITRTAKGLALRITGDKLPDEAVQAIDDVGLEDVYLYYMEKSPFNRSRWPMVGG